MTSLTIQAPGLDLTSQALIVLGKPPLAEGGGVGGGEKKRKSWGAASSRSRRTCLAAFPRSSRA